MSLFRDIKAILKRNKFHARIILIIICLEKELVILSIFFKVLRKVINQAIYHCEIPPSVFTIEALTSVRLPHPFNIIIHKSATIGKNATIFQEVTIGVIEKTDFITQAAHIGDNVYIGCKSCILGDITIANDVKIGAMSLVLKNCPEGKTIVGIYR